MVSATPAAVMKGTPAGENSLGWISHFNKTFQKDNKISGTASARSDLFLKLENLQPKSPLRFPPIIHQVFLDHKSLNWTIEATIERKKWIQSWVDQNPEFEVIVWNKEHFDYLMRTRFTSRIYEAYQKLKGLHNVVKGDFARYALLYHFGGVYADTDTICHKPVRDWNLNHEGVKMIVGVEFVTGYQGNTQTQIVQYTMVVAKRHPIVLAVLDSLADKILSRGDSISNLSVDDVVEFSGPIIWTTAIQTYMRTFGDTFDTLPHPKLGITLDDGKYVKGDEAVLFPASQILILPINGFAAGSFWTHSLGIKHPLSFVSHKFTGSRPDGWKNSFNKTD
ncbi:membrane-bound alpha-1,6- mannosyltransferase Initiation-specific [Podochytrium sp. JEL0797]|nr:membrane-bound alpha-1,6- mannosyltransferase Initiation-specific [Podochytrium sp. JEL0797]